MRGEVARGVEEGIGEISLPTNAKQRLSVGVGNGTDGVAQKNCNVKPVSAKTSSERRMAFAFRKTNKH